MAERYTSLYTLPSGLYAQGAPLVIAGGALLLDAMGGGQLFAQLKLRSISPKIISSVRLLVVGRDEAGKELCRGDHLYAELNVSRDTIFGMKEFIPLTDRGVRSFTVQVLTVSFTDGSRYLGDGSVWRPLPKQEDLNKRLFDTELIRQYKLETGNTSRYVPLETVDLWMCACGEINHTGESCCRCGQTLGHLQEYLSVERLRENKSLRLHAEAAQAALDEVKRQSRGRLLRRVLCVLVPLLLIAGAAAGVYSYSSRRAAAYEEAVGLYESGEYGEAALRFEKLGKYRDAAAMTEKAKAANAEITAYARAGRLLEGERWDEAYEAYSGLGGYLDSAELKLEALYRKGLSLIAEERFDEARALFRELGSYRDAEMLAEHFFYRLRSEETSMNLECGGPLTTDYRYDSFGRIAGKTERFSAYEGMEDRASVYHYNEDGSYSVNQGQTELLYDAHDSLLGQDGQITTTYEYEFYPDGGVQFCTGYDAQSGDYRGSSAYNEQGDLVSVQNEDGTGYTMLNEYQDGRLVKQERYNSEGVMLNRTSFEYDENGLLKRASFLTPGASASVTILYTNGLVFAPDAEA